MEANNIDVDVSRRHGVFLHCACADTGARNFTHLLSILLVQKGINTFVDDTEDDDDWLRRKNYQILAEEEEEEEGIRREDDQISAALIKIMEGSGISIIVFSENYACSSRCLDMLVKILECREASNRRMIVMPIFYKVDSADVGDQTGAFADAFAAHEAKASHDYDEEKVLSWRKALKEAANLDKGWLFTPDNTEARLIKGVVKVISALTENKAVSHSGGLPFSINVLASPLDDWQSKLQRLEIFSTSSKIVETFKKSYNAPELAMIKEVFFDNIACFFNDSSLRYHEDVFHVLTENTGTKFPVPDDEILLAAYCFLKMKNLEHFKIYNANLFGDRGCFQFLRNNYLMSVDWSNLNMPWSINSRLANPLKDISADWCFLLTNLCLEILSISFDQASSPRKPHYALYGMVLSFGAVLMCISELVYKGRREGVKLRRWGKLWWFHYPHSRYALFGTLPDFYGLIGGISQCILSTIQYVCIIRKVENPIQVSLWPAIFVLCVIASRLAKKSIQPNKRND